MDLWHQTQCGAHVREQVPELLGGPDFLRIWSSPSRGGLHPQAQHSGVGPGCAETWMGVWMGVRSSELSPDRIKPEMWRLDCDLFIYFVLSHQLMKA